jgi:hypothetical protein
MLPPLYLDLPEHRDSALYSVLMRERRNPNLDLQGGRAIFHRYGASLPPLASFLHPPQPQISNPILFLT